MRVVSNVVATGHEVRWLPPSKAPLFLGVGFLLVFASMFLAAVPVVAAVVSVVGLAGCLAALVLAWLRLTVAGRLLVAMPPVLATLAFVAGSTGATTVAQGLALATLAFSIAAAVCIVEPTGRFGNLQWGRVNRAFLRTQEVGPIVECRLEGDAVRFVGGTRDAAGEPRTVPVRELRPPQVRERDGHCDLLLVDVYGDTVIQVRASTPEERRSIDAFARALEAFPGLPPRA
jgi:hypothetical protein